MKQKHIMLIEEAIDDTINPEDWMVLTDLEADEACAEYLKETAAYCRPEFLEDITGVDAEVFAACHSMSNAEELIESIIKATDSFNMLVNEAIKLDGRGHFLASYDGEEVEIEDNGQTLYAYRIN